MIVNKILFLIIFCSYVCSSQTKNDDAYFILSTDYNDYVINAKGKELSEITKLSSIKTFFLYDRIQYIEREKQIEHDKKEGRFLEYQLYKRPDELVFTVVNDNETITTDCEIDSLNVVDYKWIEMNTWKEGNPNILFKDLYFLLKTEKDKYLKFKVKRTIIAR